MYLRVICKRIRNDCLVSMLSSCSPDLGLIASGLFISGNHVFVGTCKLMRGIPHRYSILGPVSQTRDSPVPVSSTNKTTTYA